jgi:hypothetical protein
MRPDQRRIDGGGGYVAEICLFLSVLGSALISVIAILRPRKKSE